MKIRPSTSVAAAALVVASMLGVAAGSHAAPTDPIPSAPVLSVVPASLTLPFTMEGDGEIEVAVLSDGDEVSTAAWTATGELSLAAYEGETIRVLARESGQADTSLWFDATYEVRDAFPSAVGLGSETNPVEAIAGNDPRLVAWASGWADVQYGDNVADTWKVPENAIGPVGGAGYEGNMSVVVLGDHGHITLTFDTPIQDGPGYDLAVFENGFRVGGGGADFVELGRVEVSSNGTDFVAFDTGTTHTTAVGGYGGAPANAYGGGIVGRDLNGYGTPVDLAAVANKPEVRDGTVDLDHITHVKIIDIVGDGNDLDSFGQPIYDAFPTHGSGGFDLRGVGVLHQQDAAVADAPCEGDEGVTVVVDYAGLESEGADPYRVACAPGEQANGLDALESAGFDLGWVPGYEGGAICTIDAVPAEGYPTCWYEGYWSYWHAEPGEAWEYSNWGAGNRAPEPGSVEGWRYVSLADAATPPAVGPTFSEGVDVTAPVVAFIDPPVTAEVGDAVTFAYSIDDQAATRECRLDDAEWALCDVPTGWAASYTHTVHDVHSGDHVLEIRATDTWGNVGTASTAFSVPPAIEPVVFSDIEGIHFQPEIEWLSTQGITTGYDNGDGTFSYAPSAQVLREQMAAFLYRFTHNGTNPEPVVGLTQFVDVPTDHVFKAHIAWLASTGITTGYDNGNGTKSYAPAAPVLREQMAAFLYRLAGSPEWEGPAVSPFTDLSTSHVFYDEITWLADTQITTGYDNGNGTKSFQGSAPVLREQMAAFLFRFNNLDLED